MRYRVAWHFWAGKQQRYVALKRLIFLIAILISFLLLIGPGITNELTFLVKVGGQVKFEDKIPKPFNQTFLITAVGDKWKIVSDCFRALETL